MAKYEITITCEQWTDKSSQPDEDAIRAFLDKTPLVEVETDTDEFDWTDLNANWEINVYAEFECAEGEQDEIAGKAVAVLRHEGFNHVVWSVDEEDYPMPEHEIVESFRDAVLPHLDHTDKVAVRCAFNDHVDSLNKRGMITEWQAANINNPWDKD